MKSGWRVCPACGQEFYLYIDYRTVPTAYCSRRCERQAQAANAARQAAIYDEFYKELGS